jgi:hypothetical protein
MSDIPARFNRRLTPALSRARKRERSGRCRASAAAPCSARFVDRHEASIPSKPGASNTWLLHTDLFLQA